MKFLSWEEGRKLSDKEKIKYLHDFMKVKNKEDHQDDDDWEFCNKNIIGCFCIVGFPYELMCPLCRDNRNKGDIYSRCVCPPKF